MITDDGKSLPNDPTYIWRPRWVDPVGISSRSSASEKRVPGLT